MFTHVFSVNYTRGGVTNAYQRKLFFPGNVQETLQSVTPTGYRYSKILIVSNGLCASSCSLFVTKLRYHGKAAVLGQGGIKTEPMDTSCTTGEAALLPHLFSRRERT